MGTKTQLKREDIIYPELSYEIIGVLFEVYRELGSGYREKYYQNGNEYIQMFNFQLCYLFFRPLKAHQNPEVF